jgi:hypothetical protein
VYPRLILVSCAVLVALPAQAKINNPSKHRKVKNGVGNCIFSADKLPYKKEGQFKKLTTEFDEKTKVVYARCYFAKTMQEYESDGKVGNSMRSGTPPEYYAYFHGHTGYKRARFTYKAKNKAKDQAYYYVGGPRPCDLCKDLSRLAKDRIKRYQIKAGKKSNTEKICVKVYYISADEKKWVWVRNRKEHHMVNKEKVLAEGCFNYTVKLP